ncbi:DUF6266 family protein [Sphingobacterium sp. E70]|nr:DUF6266 family protein [Sphingobacterium sp. E70]
MSQVLKVAITELSGVLSLDPEKAWLSDGNLPGVLVTDMQQLAGTITVQYFGDTGFDRCWDDRVKLIAYQAEEWVAVESAVSALRHEAKVSITIPVNLWEKDLLLYILCHERDGLRYSRSKYLGTYQIKK